MMHRWFRYLLLFVVTQLLQAFLCNNLTLGVWFNPLVYIAFVVLLPLEIPAGALLLAGAAAGVAADWFMGTAGLNTLCAVPVAFVRPYLLPLLFEKENIREGGFPSPERLGGSGFLRYAVLLIGLHHLLFFMLESLSWSRMPQTLLRIAASGAGTLFFTWLLARLFASKTTVRI